MNAGLRNPYARLIAILLLAFALRLILLETRPLWYDDAFSVLLAERGPAAIAAGTAADTMPPGYYLMLYAWMNVFGQSPLAMRMLSVALSMLIVAFVYAIGARGFGTRTGMFAALFVALMPFQIYHAQELRMYTLLALGGCIFLYGALRLARASDAPDSRSKNPSGHNWRAFAFLAAGTAMALYAHNLAFVSLLAANFYFLYKRAWRKQRQLVAAQFVGALLFSPWLVYVPTQLEKIQRAFWTPRPGLADVIQMALVFTTYLPLPLPGMAFALFVSILVLVVVVWGLLKIARREQVVALGLIVAFAIVPPILLLVLSYVIRPVFVPRGAMVSACAYAILVAVVTARAPRGIRVGAVVGALLLAGALLPFYYSVLGEWRRAPFVEADAFLRTHARAGDLILHDNKLSFFPMHLYDRTLAQSFLADPPGSDNDTLAPASQAAMELYPVPFDAAVKGHARVWFVIYQTAITEAVGAHPNLARLDAQFARAQETEYGDLRIFLYTTR
jgi:mannosyltransferase